MGEATKIFPNLKWVYHNSMLRHYKTKQSPKHNTKDAFVRIQTNLIVETSIEYCMNMRGMIFPLARKSGQTIEISFDNMLDVVKGI